MRLGATKLNLVPNSLNLVPKKFTLVPEKFKIAKKKKKKNQPHNSAKKFKKQLMESMEF